MKKAAVPSILVAVVLLAVAVIAEAQQPKKVPRIGYLSVLPFPTRPHRRHSGKVCASLGTWRGKTLSLSIDMQRENSDRLPVLAAELVRLKVEVIVAGGTVVIRPPRKRRLRFPL